MSFTFCTSEAIITEAGSGVSNTAITSGAIVAQASDNAEAYICAATKYDWIKNYSSVSSSTSYAVNLLASACTKIAGNELRKYNLTGFGSRIYVEDMINVDYDFAGRAIEQLQKLKMPKDNL